MVAYDTPHPIRPFTRKTYGRTVGPPLRGITRQATTRKTYVPRRNNATKSRLRIVKMNNEQARATKKAKNAANRRDKNELRMIRKSKKISRDWKAMVELINDPVLVDNIGVYINDEGKLVSDEGAIVPAQYEVLIEELVNRLESPNDDYDEKITNNAIRFVLNSRKAQENAREMNSLEAMMARL